MMYIASQGSLQRVDGDKPPSNDSMGGIPLNFDIFFLVLNI
jgi:hypothetical protein